jgi:hypothetical protein
MSKNLEIFEYTSANGKSWDAFSLREMLEALSISIPAGKFPMAIRLGNGADDFAVCFWDKRTSESKPSNFKRKGENTAPVMAAPLSTISPQNMLATLIARMSPADMAAMMGQPAMASATPAKQARRKSS